VDWLKQLQAEQQEAREYEYTPLMRVQSWSELPVGTPLFNTLFAFENFPVDASLLKTLGRLEVSDVQLQDRTNFPLAVKVFPSGPQLLFQIAFRPDYYDPADVARLLVSWRTLLEGIVANPSGRLELCRC